MKKKITIGLLALAFCSSCMVLNEEKVVYYSINKKIVLPYSSAVKSGNTLYVSGLVGIPPDSSMVVSGGLKPELMQIFSNLELILKMGNMDRTNIIKCTVYLNNLKDLKEFNEVYNLYFKGKKPVRTLVGVNGLSLNAKVEIDFAAAKFR